jgi:hypothetical protein
MRYAAVIAILASGLLVGCAGANNTNLNSNTVPNTNAQNINVSHPGTSPNMPPATGSPVNGNVPPGMANEKVMTPPPGMRKTAPGLLGTPIKKPTP